MAFVPDLGMDVIRQFHFDEETGVVTPCGEMVSGVKVDGLPDTPTPLTLCNPNSYPGHEP